jgi:hypothetical protein|tara:strand:- start:3335 stop:3586 length:252 start_codon:yes stop_codon:yes gene_type:complete
MSEHTDEMLEDDDMDSEDAGPLGDKAVWVVVAKALWLAAEGKDIPEDREARKADWQAKRGTYKTMGKRLLKRLEKQGYRLVKD